MSNVHPLVQQALPVAVKAAAVQQSLVAESIGRGDLIRASLLAMITGRPAFFLGPPGVNKTGTVQSLVKRIEGAIFHEELMPTLASVDQLIVERTSIEETPTATGGKSIRVHDELGRAAKAHVVFADEIWKSDARILQTVLDLAKGDGIRHDGQMVKTPLKAFLAASNELPEAEGNLAALWSRMTIRVIVNPLDRAGKKSLFATRLRRDRKNGTTAPATLTLAELDLLRAARPHVEVPDQIQDIVLDLVEALRDEVGQDFSWLWSDDRRVGRIIDVLQAAALIAGRATVTKADLAVCEWLLWDTPEQLPVVKAKLAPLCRTPLLAAEELVNMLLAPGGKMATALTGDRKVAVKAVQEAQTAQDELQKLRQAADSSDYPALDALATTVNEALKKVVAITLGTAAVS